MAAPDLVEGNVQGGGSSTPSSPVTSHYANLVLEDWAASATLAGEVLTGATPDSFDGVAKATAVSYLMPPNNDSIRLIAIGDGDKSKWGVYDVTSVDLTTLVLTRTIDLSAADAVVFPDNGDLGAGGGSLHYNADLTYTRKVLGSTDKLSGADANVPKRIATSMIYLEDQPGTLNADGTVLTLDSPLPSYDGFTPANNYYVILAGQNGNQFDVENGHWVQTSSTELTRLSWLNDFREIKHNQEYVVVKGHRWRNSVWRLVSGGSFNVNPASVPVAFECISSPNDDDDLMLHYIFSESAAPVLNHSVFGGAEVTPGQKMWRGTFSGTVTLHDTGGPDDGHRIAIGAQSAVQIEDSGSHMTLDNYNWDLEFDLKCSAKCRPLRRTQSGDTASSGFKEIFVDANGDLWFGSWGNNENKTWSPATPLTNGEWRRNICIRYRRLAYSNHGLMSARIDGVWYDGVYINNGLAGSNTSHYVRLGSTVADGQGYGAFELANVRYCQRSVRP
jgi:hypothetical protein